MIAVNPDSDQVIPLCDASNPDAIHLGVIAQSRRSGRERYFYLITLDTSLSAVATAIRWHRGSQWMIYETFDCTPPTGCTLTAA